MRHPVVAAVIRLGRLLDSDDAVWCVMLNFYCSAQADVVNGAVSLSERRRVHDGRNLLARGKPNGAIGKTAETDQCRGR